MFGEPYNGHKLSTALIQVWTYVVNKYRVNKANNFYEISPINGNVFQYANNNTVCVYQNSINTFLNISTVFNYDIITVDAMNAYTQDPPPNEPFYAYVDNQYI